MPTTNDDTGVAVPPNSQSVPGPFSVVGDLTVTGSESVGVNLSVVGSATVGSASVTGNETVGGTLGVTGAFTPSQTNGIVGTTTNNNANAGSVGEMLSASTGTPGVSLSNGVQVNVLSLSLTAGDWECSGAVAYKFAGTTNYTLLAHGISTTSATLDQTIGHMAVMVALSGVVPGAAGLDTTVVVPSVRISIATTTTIYLVADASFTVSTLSAYGMLRARRVR